MPSAPPAQWLDTKAMPATMKEKPAQVSGAKSRGKPARERQSYATKAATKLPTIPVFIHKGKTRPEYCVKEDFQEAVQHLQKMWCDQVLAGKDMSQLPMVNATWRSTNGQGTIECSNQVTVDWVVKAVSSDRPIPLYRYRYRYIGQITDIYLPIPIPIPIFS